MNSHYKPADNFWELEPTVALPADDPRYLNSLKARGNVNEITFLNKLGVAKKAGAYVVMKKQKSFLGMVSGHIGNGKSTEMNQILGKLQKDKCFFCL